MPKKALHRPNESAGGSDVDRLTRRHKKILTQGLSKVDGRLTAVRRMRTWKKAVINDLGGPGSLSTLTETAVEALSRHLLILEDIDRYILEQRSLIDRRKGKLKPLVMDRTRIADSMKGYLTLLGLERRSKVVPALGQYIDAQYSTKTSEQAPGG